MAVAAAILFNLFTCAEVHATIEAEAAADLLVLCVEGVVVVESVHARELRRADSVLFGKHGLRSLKTIPALFPGSFGRL